MDIRKDTSVRRASRSWDRSLVLELLVLALTIWVAHYFHFGSLGLYEDDYSHTSPALGWGFRDLVNSSVGELAVWDLGRPLGFILGPLLAFVGAQLGGLRAMYIIAYLVQATNGVLFYFLMRRIGRGNVALIGALIFALFPADTTHTFLMHAFGLHTSLTFLLAATHSYLSGRKTLAYGLSVACLLIYESPYAVFLAVPLLCEPWDRKFVKELRRHVFVWVAILLAVVAIRAALGEGRIEDLGSSASSLVVTGLHIIAAMGIGPATSLAMFWQGPSWTLLHWNRELTFVFVGCLIMFAWVLWRSRSGFLESEIPGSFQVRPLSGGREARRCTISRPQTARLLVTSLVMLGLAYAFSFTHYPPTATYGRLTSVHLAAAFGGALLFACLVSLFLSLAASRQLGAGAIVLVAAYLSWVTAYRVSIQQDFVRAWDNERRFWSSVVQQVPDLADGTIILVTKADLPTTHFIATNSWADPIVLEQVFRFPDDWQRPPRLFVVQGNWTKSVVREGDQLQWQVPAATWDTHWEALPDSNVVLLTMENGTLVRQFDDIQMHRLTLHLKPLFPNAGSALPRGALYPLLICATN